MLFGLEYVNKCCPRLYRIINTVENDSFLNLSCSRVSISLMSFLKLHKEYLLISKGEMQLIMICIRFVISVFLQI